MISPIHSTGSQPDSEISPSMSEFAMKNTECDEFDDDSSFLENILKEMSIMNDNFLEFEIADEPEKLLESVTSRLTLSDAASKTPEETDKIKNPDIDYSGSVNFKLFHPDVVEENWLPSFRVFTWSPPTTANVSEISKSGEENIEDKMASKESEDVVDLEHCDPDCDGVGLIDECGASQSPSCCPFDNEEELLKDVNEREREDMQNHNQETVRENAKVVQPTHVDNIEETQQKIPETQLLVAPKFNFLRKFATSSGKLSKNELEELLTAKIIEVSTCSSENAKLRERIEKQEHLLESMVLRVENLKGKYSDLEIIHNRVMDELRERYSSAIPLVKETREFGLQVYPLYQLSKSLHLEAFKLSPQNSEEQPKKRILSIDALGKSVELSDINDDSKRQKISEGPLMQPPSPDSNIKYSKEGVNASGKKKRISHIKTRRLTAPSVPYARKSTSSNNLSANTICAEVKKVPSTYQTPAPGSSSQIENRSLMLKSLPTTNGYIKMPPQMLNPPQPSKPGFKKVPNRPNVNIMKKRKGIVVSWNIENYDTNIFAAIKNYEIYSYKYVSGPQSIKNWKKLAVDGIMKTLPMSVTLLQFTRGKFCFIELFFSNVNNFLIFYRSTILFRCQIDR